MTGDRPSNGKVDRHLEDLEAAEDELRALKDTIVDGLIIIDEGRTVLSFNPGAERIFGYAGSDRAVTQVFTRGRRGTTILKQERQFPRR